MADASSRDPAPAVTRALGILSVLADAEGTPLTLSDLARALDLAKSSTANLTLALEEGGMIQRTAQGYLLGRRTAELGGAFAARFNQVREFYGVCDASPVLRTEVVQITMLDGADTLYLARHEGRERLGTPLGSRLPTALSASGNALLMPFSDEEIVALLAPHEPFPRRTPNSVTTVAEVLEKVRAARERGYAIDQGEAFGGVSGVAVPLEAWTPFDPPLAMGAALPNEVATPENFQRLGEALLEAARQLTNPFSHRAPAS